MKTSHYAQLKKLAKKTKAYKEVTHIQAVDSRKDPKSKRYIKAFRFINRLTENKVPLECIGFNDWQKASKVKVFVASKDGSKVKSYERFGPKMIKTVINLTK